jgi:hypothetical protein
MIARRLANTLSRLGINVVKVYMTIIFFVISKVFVLDKPFQPSLIFVGKARSLP